MIYVGVDPGGVPTIVVVNNSKITIYEGSDLGFAVPRVGRTGKKTHTMVASPELIASVFQSHQLGATEHMVVIERVSMRPNENIATGQRFVGSMYMTIGICVGLGLNWRAVMPAVWKKQMQVPGKSQDEANDLVRRAALLEYPYSAPLLRRKMDHNRAEALLLAAWGKKFGAAAPKGMLG